MTSQEFYNNLNNSKTSFSQKETADLNNIVTEFPYFQAASFILMKALYINNDSQYKSKLANTAANISNRESLFNYIYSEYSIKDKVTEKTSTPKPSNTTIKSSKEITKPKALQNKKGEEIKSKAGLIKEVKERLDEVEQEKRKTKERRGKVKEEELKASEEKGKEKVETSRKIQTKEKSKAKAKPIDRGSSIDIVEKFIKTKPNINRPDDKEYNEEIKLANKSLNEDYDLVSETMAKLFVKQGHKEKAIKIYKKLILIYPEKNTYFAARISELNN
jgi:tetratricopeptide (TPR) repeat protein